MIRTLAAGLAVFALVIFLWWPPEVYEEFRDIDSTLLWLFFLTSLFCMPVSPGNSTAGSRPGSVIFFSLVAIFYA